MPHSPTDDRITRLFDQLPTGPELMELVLAGLVLRLLHDRGCRVRVVNGLLHTTLPPVERGRGRRERRQRLIEVFEATIDPSLSRLMHLADKKIIEALVAGRTAPRAT
jgi:hypothetical protein